MSQLNVNLRRRAIAWAGQLTKRVREYAPTHIDPAISSHVEDKNDGEYIIHLLVDRQIAPDARAQELGSGLHAKRGPQKEYPIYPKEKKALAFFWEVLDDPDSLKMMWASKKFIGLVPDDGRGIFRWVDHPGIEATNEGQGYIAPAISDFKGHAKETLSEDVRSAITGDIRKSFGAKR